MDRNIVFEYFYIKNTIDEYHTATTGQYKTFEAAREALKGMSDWYCHNDTGTIFKCTFVCNDDDSLEEFNERVFEKTQLQAIKNLDGTYFNN